MDNLDTASSANDKTPFTTEYSIEEVIKKNRENSFFLIKKRTFSGLVITK